MKSYAQQLGRAATPQASSGVVIRGPYTSWSWPQNGYYSDTEERLTISHVTTSGAHLFFAHQFAWQNGIQGYVGLQDGSYPSSGKIALFSVWSATGAQGANCGTFSGEGSGYTCRIDPYLWKTDRTYQLEVQKGAVLTSGVWYTASVLDTVTGIRQKIGSIRIPDGWGAFQGWVSWTEDFGGPVPQCSDLPRSRVSWQYPTAEHGSVNVTGHSNTFGTGDCQTKIKNVTGGVLQIIPAF